MSLWMSVNYYLSVSGNKLENPKKTAFSVRILWKNNYKIFEHDAIQNFLTANIRISISD